MYRSISLDGDNVAAGSFIRCNRLPFLSQLCQRRNTVYPFVIQLFLAAARFPSVRYFTIFGTKRRDSDDRDRLVWNRGYPTSSTMEKRRDTGLLELGVHDDRGRLCYGPRRHRLDDPLARLGTAYLQRPRPAVMAFRNPNIANDCNEAR